jgi:uncharacterized protein with PIN domain
MPGLLADNARCPKCNTPLEAIVRTSDSDGVTAEYFHVRPSWKARRRRRRGYVRCALIGPGARVGK